MNKTLGLCALLLAAALPAAAATGVFGSYLAIDPDGDGAATPIWFGGLQPGSSLLTSFNGASLGSFQLGATATLSGAELLTWKNGGSDVTGGVLNWRVDGGAYQSVAINFTSNATFQDRAGNSFGNAGDQRWASLSTAPNFLSGVAAGTHTLDVYFTAFTSAGQQLSGSAANPFTATFSVVSPVPEPSSLGLLLAGMGVIAWMRRSRRT